MSNLNPIGNGWKANIVDNLMSTFFSIMRGDPKAATCDIPIPGTAGEQLSARVLSLMGDAMAVVRKNRQEMARREERFTRQRRP